MGAPDDALLLRQRAPAPRRELPAFRIGRTPITNATFLHFVEGGGYQRREWWSDEGWAWKEEYDITHPQGWAAGPGRMAAVAHRRMVAAATPTSRWSTSPGSRPTPSPEPTRARLPTEAEWEKAATWTQRDAFSSDSPNLDQTGARPAPGRRPAPPASRSACSATRGSGPRREFDGYRGFVAHPYREYSEVFFRSGYNVLRGGSWATRARVATPTFRNWDLPQRRQIFSGVRLAWDA